MAVNRSFAQGIDLSRWQPGYDPMVRPVDFVILKASEGSTWLDPKFDEHLAVCDAAGLLVGAYHYYRSGIPWRAQLDNFLRATQGKRLSKLLAIDYEYINNKLDASTDKELKAFYDALVQRGYQPVIYTSHGEYMSMIARGAKWISDPSIGMWIARWFERSYYYNYALGPGAAITQWTKGHCIWQYGGDYRDKAGWEVPGTGEGAAYGVAGSYSVDLNVYNGTAEQMRADFEAPEPLPVEAETPSTGGGLTWAQKKLFNDYGIFRRQPARMLE